MIVLDLGFLIAALDAGIKGVGGVGGDFLPKQVERKRIMEIELLLNRWQVDDAQRAHLRDVVRAGDARRCHRLACPLNGAADAVSPTNIWCASSVSMKQQVRESGSKPDCARLSSCILPSRSVK